MSATSSRADRCMGLRVHKYSIHVDDEKREKDKERKIKAGNLRETELGAKAIR